MVLLRAWRKCFPRVWWLCALAVSSGQLWDAIQEGHVEHVRASVLAGECTVEGPLSPLMLILKRGAFFQRSSTVDTQVFDEWMDDDGDGDIDQIIATGLDAQYAVDGARPAFPLNVNDYATSLLLRLFSYTGPVLTSHQANTTTPHMALHAVISHFHEQNHAQLGHALRHSPQLRQLFLSAYYDRGRPFTHRSSDMRTAVHAWVNALMRALTAAGRCKIEQFLAPADVRFLRRTPLHVAAETGNVNAVRYLLRLGANCSARDTYGAAPMHLGQ